MPALLSRICLSCLTTNAVVFAGSAIVAYGFRCKLNKRKPNMTDALKVGVEGAVVSAVLGPLASRFTRPLFR